MWERKQEQHTRHGKRSRNNIQDMGTKVDIVTCTAWEHLTAWHKGILNILDDNPLTTGLVQGDVVAVLPNATMRLPMSIDISEVLKCKHSFHAHFK